MFLHTCVPNTKFCVLVCSRDEVFEDRTQKNYTYAFIDFFDDTFDLSYAPNALFGGKKVSNFGSFNLFSDIGGKNRILYRFSSFLLERWSDINISAHFPR